MPYQSLPHAELGFNVVVRAIGREQLQGFRFIAGIGDIKCPELRAHQGSQFGQKRTGYRQQIALALHHAGELGNVSLQPVLIGILARGLGKVDNHLVDVVLERGHFTQGFDRDRPCQVALGDSRSDVGDRADLGSQVGGELVDVVRQVAPDSGRAGHQRLAAQFAFDADLAGHVAHLIRKHRQGVDHAVDGVRELGNLALSLQYQLAFQVAVSYVSHHLGDAADLGGEVGGHEIHVVSQILPRAGHSAHLGLAAQLALSAHFTRDASHLRGEAVELIDHGVDSVFQLQNFSLHIHRDLAAQVPIGYCSGYLSDVAYLGSQVACHGIDAVSQVFPRAGHAAHFGLAAQLALCAHFARHAGHLSRK